MSHSETTDTALRPPTITPKKGVAFVALRHPDYRAYFATSMLTMLGDFTEHVITYWIIFQVFHSPLLAGFAVISHWTPYLLLSVYCGTLADRFDCRRLIQVSQAMLMGSSLAWGLLYLTSTLQVWHAVILFIVHGLAGVLMGPASQLIIHDIVGPDQLQSAVRLNSTGVQLGLLGGPALGGVLMELLGPAPGLLVNALVYLPRILWLLTVPYTGHQQAARHSVSGRGLGLGDAIRVLRELSGNRTIIAMVILASANGLLIGDAFMAQMPEYAHRLGMESGLAYSALFVATAIGAIMTGLLLDGTGLLRPQARTAVICAGLWALAIGSFAFAPTYAVAFTLLILGGSFSLAFSSMAQTLVQLLAPPHLRGRAVGLYITSFLGLRVSSGVTVGVLGSIIGINWSLALSAAALFAITLGLLTFVPQGRAGGLTESAPA